MFKRKNLILISIFVVCCLFLYGNFNINTQKINYTLNTVSNFNNIIDDSDIKVNITENDVNVDGESIFIMNSSIPYLNIKIPRLNQLTLFNNSFIVDLNFNILEFGQLNNGVVKNMKFYIDDVSDEYNYEYNLKLGSNKLLVGEYYIKYNYNYSLKNNNLLRVIKSINIPMFGIFSDFNINNCKYRISYENIEIEKINLYKINSKKLDLDVRFSNPYKSSQFINTYVGTLQNYLYSADKFIGVICPIANGIRYNKIFLYICLFCFSINLFCIKFVIHNRKNVLNKKYNKSNDISNQEIENDNSFFINLGILKNKIFTADLIYIDIVKLAIDGFLHIHIKNSNIFLELIKDYKEDNINNRYLFVLSTLFKDTKVLYGNNLKEKYYLLYNYYTTYYNKSYYKENFIYKKDIIIKYLLLIINYISGLLFTYFICGGSVNILLFTANYVFISLLFIFKHKNNNYYLSISIAMLMLLLYNIYYISTIIIYNESIVLSLIYLIMYIIFLYITVYISMYDGVIYNNKYNSLTERVSNVVNDIAEGNMLVEETILYVIALRLYDIWVINYAETEDKLDWFIYEDDVDMYDKNGFKELLLYISSLDDIL